MDLTAGERFRMCDEIVTALASDYQWTDARISRLYTTHGISDPTPRGSIMTDVEWERELGEPLSTAHDEALESLLRLVSGAPTSRPSDQAVSGIWNGPEIRLFISHLAAHKAFASSVARTLAKDGIHGFVAHTDIDVSREWQGEIETALLTCEAFVALAHEPFWSKPWTNQEVGWAYGRRVPSIFIDLGAGVPQGFPSRIQAVKGNTAEGVADEITRFLNRDLPLAGRIADARIAALGKAQSFVHAEAMAQAVASCGSLTEEQWEALARVCRSNDQIYRGRLPSRVLASFFKTNARPLPEGLHA